MEKLERGQLLRARFRALGGIPYPSRPPKPKLNNQPLTPKVPGRWQPFFGVSLYECRPQWVNEPDPKPKKRLGARNRKTKCAVVRIAEVAPKKLMLDREKIFGFFNPPGDLSRRRPL